MNAEYLKAKELIERFMTPIDELHSYPMCFDTAKQCALICVDEIIDEFFGDDSAFGTRRYNYWQQVRNEIINFK